MASSMRKLTKMSEWKPRARERALLFAMISGPLALLLVAVMIAFTGSILARLPKPVNTYSAITDVTRVQNYARNSLLLWMGGSSSSQKPLMQRSSASQSIELSPVPFEVRSIDPSDIVRWQGSDAAEWQVTFAVTFVAPGSSSAQINRFVVTVLDREGDYQLLMWPSIVNIDTQPFKVATKYTVPVDSGGSMGQSLGRFVTAYLTSTGGATSLGQYVSSKFVGSAIADTPYSSAEVQEIRAEAGTGTVGTAQPGTTVKVLVKVKASASIQTWSIMHLALRVTLGSNNVWLVDGIDAPIGWGEITGK
ncbi:hypothetical protein ACT17_15405 [Mycolicibacterium conceptionense]|uniref:Conjugative transposon protein TcpC n=1 Tax=Mycolicibacterium conceptionense TaxID=451644 RepID=A0A0J8U8E2_9MYCO|nr:conjugal transfer protein [Mycolicibacterium conceptionense]KMV17656.1 hypothetical protein ACT17_15405 [Mycolicibacterium conceptionense]